MQRIANKYSDEPPRIRDLTPFEKRIKEELLAGRTSAEIKEKITGNIPIAKTIRILVNLGHIKRIQTIDGVIYEEAYLYKIKQNEGCA